MTNYECNSQFYVRVPFLSYNFFQEKLLDSSASYQQLVEDSFKENLLTNSVDLYRSMLDHKNGTDMINQSVLKYLIRASTRPTPYGLNSGVIPGSFSPNSKNQIVINQFKKKSRPDMEWLSKIIKKCEKSLGTDLKIIINNTFSHDSFTVSKDWNSYFMNTAVKQTSTIRINYTKAVQCVFNICSKYVSIKEVINQLLIFYPKLEPNYLYKFIYSLIDNEFITTELRSALVIPNQFDVFISKIKNYPKESVSYFKDLEDIQALIESYDKLEVSEGIETYLNIIKKMEKLVQSKNYLQIDMYQEQEIILPASLRKNLSDFAKFLSKWTFNERYLEYINRFKERYGEQAVKFLDVIDPQIGLGIPAVDQNEAIIFKDKIESAFLSAILKSVGKKEDSIDLSLLDIPKEGYDEDKILDSSAELSFFINKKEENYTFTFSPLIGSSDARKSIGRFNQLFTEINHHIKHKEDFQAVEVTFLPNESHHANVLTYTSDISTFLEYGTETQTTDLQKISLERIYLFVYENELKFIDKASGKILHFNASNMFNIEAYPTILKTLLEINEHQKAPLLTLQLQLMHIVNSLKVNCPRIVYHNFILIPKNWRFDTNKLMNRKKIILFDEFCALVTDMRVNENLPELVLVGPSDQKLLLDTSLPEHLKILYKIIKKNPMETMFENTFLSDSLLLKNSQNEKFIGEFVFSVEKKEESKQLAQIDPEKIIFMNGKKIAESTYTPFNEWVSFKFYFQEYLQDRFILDFILALYYSEQGVIEEFFYIRYKDPKAHMRIRFKVNPDKMSDFLEILLTQLQQKEWKKEIAEYVIDSYIPEMERYGGNTCMTLAEQLFYHESLSTMELIQLIQNKQIPYSKTELFIISACKLLEDMGITLKDQVYYLSDFRSGKKFREEYNRLANKLDFLIDGRDNWKALRTSESGLKIYLSFQQREKSSNLYWKQIEAIHGDEFNRKKYITQSILHMHFNRFVGMDRGLEKRTMGHLYKFIYTKFSKQKHLREG